MKREKLKHELGEFAALGAIVFFVACLWWVTGRISPAEAQNPQWYDACTPDNQNHFAWMKCVTDQMTFEPPCHNLGTINAEDTYKCLNAFYWPELYPDVAPDGKAWHEHFYHRDKRAREVEACNACLRTARNRRSCRC